MTTPQQSAGSRWRHGLFSALVATGIALQLAAIPALPARAAAPTSVSEEAPAPVAALAVKPPVAPGIAPAPDAIAAGPRLPESAPINPAPPALQVPVVYNDSPTYLSLATSLWVDTGSCDLWGNMDILWNLGDGTFVGGSTVAHTYPETGVYTATVVVTCHYWYKASQQESGTTTVTIVEAPITGLAASNDSPTGIGAATHLSSTVTLGSHITYTWSLGDGSIATGANVTHTYAQVGSYTAVVTATNPMGTVTATTGVLISPFVQDNTDLTGLTLGDIAWGDYDNDGDLDMIATGLNSGNTPTTLVYYNVSGKLTSGGSMGLPQVYDSAVAWGDYDGDGILDLAISGCTVYNNCSASNSVASIYHGTGSSFTFLRSVYDSFGVFGGDLAWFDYDNNGFQDLLVTGCTWANCQERTTVVLAGNGAGNFALASTPSVPPMDRSAVAIADYDKDGRQDVLIAGCTDRDGAGACLTRSTRLFRNTASGLSDSGFAFIGVDSASAAWGDYNDDGWLDFVLNGWPSGSTIVTRIYRNDGGAGFSSVGGLGLPHMGSASAAWGDFDNDGWSDILITGRASSTWISRLYRNNGGTFSLYEAGLADVSNGTVAWGDYNNDGLLDAAMIGSGTMTIYRNAGFTANNAPSAPTGLDFDVQMTTSGAVANFTWNAATDTETISPALSYNLRLGTSSGGSQAVPPLSRSSGYRLVPALGNTGPARTAIVELSPGASYSWTVQSVDTALAGSAFATQRRFTATWFGDFFHEENLSNPLPQVDEGDNSWADYDKDGDLDLFVCGYSSSGPLYAANVYRNDGAAGFTQIATLTGVRHCSSTWSDYNNDGWPDLLVLGSTSSSSSGAVTKLYRGPSFTEVSTGFTNVTDGAAAWGDYNNDGFQDLLLTGRNTASSPVTQLYRSDGDGTFTLVSNTGIAAFADSAAAWADYNNDGWLDVVVVGYNDGHIYQNNADGTFTASASSITSAYNSAVAWGDYDEDGYLDLLVSGCPGMTCSGPVTKLYHNNGTSFSDTASSLTGAYSGNASWADLDSDGHLDILLSGLDPSDVPFTKVYRGNGTASFTDLPDTGLIPTAGGRTAWGDFDNDGVLDVALVGYYEISGTHYRTARIYRGNSKYYNTPPSTPTGLTSTINPYSVRLSWNASSDPSTPNAGLTYNLRVGTTPGGSEIMSSMSITAAGAANGFRLVPRQGNNGHAQAIDLREMAAGNYYWSVQAVDFGLAGSDFATEQTFSVPYFTSLGASGLPAVTNGAVAWARLSPTNTQRSELAVTGMASGSTRITKIYQVGLTGVTTHTVNLPGLSQSRLAWGDYDGDGSPDLVVAGDSGTAQVTRLYHGNSDGTFNENTNADLVGVSDGSLEWGDFDNDGDQDLLLTGWSGATPLTKIYRNNGNGTFTDINASLVGVGNGAATWGDYNNDGYLDVAVVGWIGGTGREARIYRNNGNGTFTGISAGLTGVAWASAAWGDYDGDGWVDLVIAGCTTIVQAYGETHCSDSSSLLYHNNGNGTFTQAGVTLTGAASGSLTWADYDNDGDSDLLVTGRDYSGHWNCSAAGCWHDESASVGTLYRNTSGAFTALTGSIGTLFKSAAAWADFDGDTKLDLVLTGCATEAAGSCTDFTTVLYRNATRFANAAPATPSALAVSIDGASVTLSWTAPTDDRTPAAGLTYNLRVGTSITGNQVLPSLASFSGQLRLVPKDGNVRQGITATLTGLSLGQTYNWTVQAIDSAFAPSAFASGGTFTVPWFSDISGTGLPSVADGAVAWGDYNSDGRLDALVTGRSSAGWIARVYTNGGGGVFTDSSAGLPGLAYSSAAWGDYDNDGDVDILLAGDTGAGYVSRIYRNNGNGTFSNSGISLPGVAFGAADWVDYDRDGRLDVMLTGWTGSAAITRLYLNAGGGVFNLETRSAFLGLWRSSAAWADYDNNGLPDLFISGCADSPCTIPVSRMYENGGAGVFTEVALAEVPGLADGSSAWGDYDNDGAMDLLVTGFTSTLGLTNTTGVSAIFHNNAGVLAPVATANLTRLGSSAAAWGDYDNDGLLDIVLTGYTNTTRITQVYHNEGAGVFTALTGSGVNAAVNLGAVAWGDYNSDGRLDILLVGDTGSGVTTRLYRNNYPVPGVPPGAPASTAAVLTGTTVTLSWLPGPTGDTPAGGLSYNLRLGTTPGGNETVSGMSRSDGRSLAAHWGNSGQLSTTVVTDLAAGTTYYWSVQAIDNAFVASPFSAQGAFTIEARIVGLQIANDSPTWLGTPTTLTATVSAGRNITYEWSLGDGSVATGAVVTHTYPAVGLYTVGVTATNVVSNAYTTAQVLVPDFMPITATLPSISEASAAWGDYDNDGDLDLLLTGKRGSSYISKVYRNDAGAFTETAGAGLTGVYRGGAVWGDYDNDGDLDIALAGDTGAGLIARIYRNDGGGAFSPSAALQGIAAASLAWGDYDNDSDLDLALGGCTDAGCTQRVTRVYRNDGAGAFTALVQTFTGVSDSSLAWGDYDRDGRLDLLVTGYTGSARSTLFYRNLGDDSFASQGDLGLPGLRYGSLAWFDMDRDGALDLALCGESSSGPTAQLYRGYGNGTFSLLSWPGASGVTRCTVAVGDYDGDGLPDVLLSGDTGSGLATRVFANLGDGQFALRTTAGLRAMSSGAAHWGDYDNDGSLDLVLAGDDGALSFTAVYRANDGDPAFAANTPPAPPVSLNSSAVGDGVALSWSPGVDSQTPSAGLSYNVHVGQSSGAADTLSGMVGSDGYRRLPQMGNAGTALSLTLQALSPRNTYFWSVQSVDGAYAGSPFTTEKNFRPTWFAPGESGLPPVYNGAAAWADYDRDGDLDVLMTGLAEAGYLSRIYSNDRDGTFTDIGAGLPGVYNSAVAWGDYDRDGIMDLALSGDNGVTTTTKIYHNLGSSFADSGAVLPGVTYGALAWADYDMDGDLDLFLSGCRDSGCTMGIARLYRNDGGSTFTQVTTTSFPGVAYSAVAWADADNDGDPDLAMSGLSGGGRLARLYVNDGGGVFTDLNLADLPAVSEGSLAWGDYNDDGRMDLVVTGWDGAAPVAVLLRNQGSGVFTSVPTAGLTGVFRGAATWGDYDNDGLNDLLIAGCTNAGCTTRATALYHNDNAGYLQPVTNSGLPGVERTTLAWGDVNNDGDFDLLLTGWTGSAALGDVYINSDRLGAYGANTVPSAPVTLTSGVTGTSVILAWTGGADTETPSEGLTYNFRVGITPGGSQIAIPQSLTPGGARQIPASGNADYGVTASLEGLTFTTYYWSVQAVDTAFAGSPFATEQTFTVDQPITDLLAINDSPTLLGSSTSFTATAIGTNVTYIWSFGDGITATGQIVTHTYTELGQYIATVVASNLASVQSASTAVDIEHRFISGLHAGNNGPTALGGATTLTATVGTGFGTTYTWALGDGVTAAGATVTHTYSSVGQYTAIVTATNAASSAVTQTIVTVDQALTGLSATSSGNTVLGSATTFTATSAAGSNVAYHWAFGDGGSAMGATVNHTYGAIGAYTTTIVAVNSVSRLTGTLMVRVDQAVAGLLARNDSPTALGFPTVLSATVTAGSNLSYTWSLGDGTTAVGPTVSHEYPDIGEYTAVVTVSNSASALQATSHVSIQGVADLAISKAASPGNVLVGREVTFTVIITSVGPFTATGVSLVDPIPAGVTFGGIVAGDAVHDSGLNAIRWTGGFSSPLVLATSLITTPFEWNDIRDMGRLVDWGADDDENTVAITLPWSIPFFGEYHRVLYVGANGNVGFDGGAGGGYNQNGSIPEPALPNDRVAAFYADLSGPRQISETFGLAVDGGVYTATVSAPDRFIVQYTNWADWNKCTRLACEVNTFQIVFYRSGPVAVYYQSVPAAPPSLRFHDQPQATGVGMEDATGAGGLVWPGVVSSGNAWTYRPMLSHKVVYTGIVSTDLAPGVILSSTALVAATSVDGNLADNSATASFVVDKPELQVTKTLRTPMPRAGMPVTYTIQITNSGTLPLHMLVTDILPLRVQPSGVLTWTPALTTRWSTWSATVTLTPTLGYSGTLANSVTVVSTEGATGTAQTAIMLYSYQTYLPVITRQP